MMPGRGGAVPLGRAHGQDARARRRDHVSGESVKALAGTLQVSKYCNSSFNILARQFWLDKYGCTSVYKSVSITF